MDRLLQKEIIVELKYELLKVIHQLKDDEYTKEHIMKDLLHILSRLDDEDEHI
ncbi:hypothetical protein [Thermaerobacillus caldiproteolyticus]|uniref:Uncharacterized protein n=1 Tax=Thermaerobacillus caldiproteolyticus TaxID=247480 RepID=A0A7V9ZAH6_9BACL|nr:hypothetical protein [Anoxybacillus caldiproteolyticus]MBA2876871.1 hypothetical protein [Anoxybacillus caldiproteolyticus]